jgi:hypothetical protein
VVFQSSRFEDYCVADGKKEFRPCNHKGSALAWGAYCLQTDKHLNSSVPVAMWVDVLSGTVAGCPTYQAVDRDGTGQRLDQAGEFRMLAEVVAGISGAEFLFLLGHIFKSAFHASTGFSAVDSSKICGLVGVNQARQMNKTLHLEHEGQFSQVAILQEMLVVAWRVHFLHPITSIGKFPLHLPR